jgi:hypothetical protein
MGVGRVCISGEINPRPSICTDRWRGRRGSVEVLNQVRVEEGRLTGPMAVGSFLSLDKPGRARCCHTQHNKVRGGELRGESWGLEMVMGMLV